MVEIVEDGVAHVHDLVSGETDNLALSWNHTEGGSVSEEWFVFPVKEGFQRSDLNGDGDTDDAITHVYDLVADETINLGLDVDPGYMSGRIGDAIAFGIDEREHGDLDGDGDATDHVLHLFDIAALRRQPRFRRADCNGDATVDLSDATCILNWLFLAGATPGCIAAANTNGDGTEDISDATYVLNHLFLGGPRPIAPYPGCGPGTLPSDETSCVTPPAGCL